MNLLGLANRNKIYSFSALWCTMYPYIAGYICLYVSLSLCVLISVCPCLYWAVQVGLLTPLTFARHRLSSLAAFTSGAYFLHNGRRWHWICEFYTASFLEARSQNMSGNKQQLVARAIGCPKTHFFPRTRDLLVSQKTTQRRFFPPTVISQINKSVK